MFLGKRHIAKINLIFLLPFFTFIVGNALYASTVTKSEFLEIRGFWGSACFLVKVADTPSKRAKGLMHIDHMPKDQGMLFVYPEPTDVSFWMKNTKIPLDMLFLNSAGRVEYIHSNAKPQDRTIINGGKDIQYVVEINGGLSEKLGISIGSFGHHWMISKEPILSCTFNE